MAGLPLAPLSKTLQLRTLVFGCVTHGNEGALETVVLDGNTRVPLRGADKREGLALGPGQPLSWLVEGNPEVHGNAPVQLRGPIFDPFTGSIYGSTYGRHAVVRLLKDASAVVVAGSREEAGRREDLGRWRASKAPAA